MSLKPQSCHTFTAHQDKTTLENAEQDNARETKNIIASGCLQGI